MDQIANRLTEAVRGIEDQDELIAFVVSHIVLAYKKGYDDGMIDLSFRLLEDAKRLIKRGKRYSNAIDISSKLFERDP